MKPAMTAASSARASTSRRLSPEAPFVIFARQVDDRGEAFRISRRRLVDELHGDRLRLGELVAIRRSLTTVSPFVASCSRMQVCRFLAPLGRPRGSPD